MTDTWSKAIDAGLSYLRTDGDAGDYRTSVEGVLRAALASMEADGLVLVSEPARETAARVLTNHGRTQVAANLAARRPFPESN
jgi:hypothetical protein